MNKNGKIVLGTAAVLGTAYGAKKLYNKKKQIPGKREVDKDDQPVADKAVNRIQGGEDKEEAIDDALEELYEKRKKRGKKRDDGGVLVAEIIKRTK